jgi:hypothetical protein
VPRAIRDVDAAVAIADARPMEQLVDTAPGSRRYRGRVPRSSSAAVVAGPALASAPASAPADAVT